MLLVSTKPGLLGPIGVLLAPHRVLLAPSKVLLAPSRVFIGPIRVLSAPSRLLQTLPAEPLNHELILRTQKTFVQGHLTPVE